MNSDEVRNNVNLSEEDEDMLVSQLNVDINDQYVIFSVGQEEFGVPVLAVQEIISLGEYSRIPGTPDYIPGIINIRGMVIPLYHLKRRLGIEGEDSSKPVVVILQLEEGPWVGFIVDAVSDVMNISGEHLQETPNFSSTVDVNYIDQIGQVGNRMIMLISIEQFFTQKDKAILTQAVKGPS